MRHTGQSLEKKSPHHLHPRSSDVSAYKSPLEWAGINQSHLIGIRSFDHTSRMKFTWQIRRKGCQITHLDSKFNILSSIHIHPRVQQTNFTKEFPVDHKWAANHGWCPMGERKKQDCQHVVVFFFSDTYKVCRDFCSSPLWVLNFPTPHLFIRLTFSCRRTGSISIRGYPRSLINRVKAALMHDVGLPRREQFSLHSWNSRVTLRKSRGCLNKFQCEQQL